MSRRIFTLLKFSAIPIIPITCYKIYISYNRYSDNPNVLTGYEFNKKFNNSNNNKFYSFLGENPYNYGNDNYYKNGLNTSHLQFNPTGGYTDGGLYFCDEHNIDKCICSLGELYSEVDIPYSAYVYIDKNTYRASKLKFKSIKNRTELFNTLDTKNIFGIIKSQPHNLCYVPDDLATKELSELYKLAVNNNGLTLKYVRKDLITNELCELAVNEDGLSLKYVPDNFITKELCELAVNKKGSHIEFVPDNFKTKELCTSAITNGCKLCHVPYDLRTKELCELAVNKNGLSLEFVPDNFKTKELCELAVNKIGLALEFVPNNFKTKELCISAITNGYGYSLRYVPDNLKTQDLCELAVSRNGMALQFVPNDLITEELCKVAVGLTIRAHEYVPAKFKYLFYTKKRHGRRYDL